MKKKSRFTVEQIVRILQEAETGQKPREQLCKDHSVVAFQRKLCQNWRRSTSEMSSRTKVDQGDLRILEMQQYLGQLPGFVKFEEPEL